MEARGDLGDISHGKDLEEKMSGFWGGRGIWEDKRELLLLAIELMAVDVVEKAVYGSYFASLSLWPFPAAGGGYGFLCLAIGFSNPASI